MKGNNPETFKAGDVRGLMLHQTDCYYGSDKQSDEWLGRRALKIGAHVVVYQNGLIAICAPLTWIMNHGNDVNRFCWGIEVEGKYHGLPDHKMTGQRSFQSEARKSLQEALEYLVGRGVAMGHDLGFLWAHRQSSVNRRRDPGPEIWQAGVEVADSLGLKTELDRTWDQGYPIPQVWDSRSRHPY
jgi:hypothetical protein